MSHTLLNPTAQATLHILRKAFNKQVDAGKAALKVTDTALGDITAIIELTHEHFHGSLAFAFNSQTAFSFTQFLINETHVSINETVKHIASDVAVMIGGEIKRRFADLGVTVSLKHPKVLAGYQQKVEHPLPGIKIVFPFNTEDGIVFLESCFHTFKANPLCTINNDAIAA